MVGWHSTSEEHVREAQERQGWTDEQLLERMLRVVGHGPAPDFPQPRLQAEYDALPPGTPVADRVAFLTDRLPALSGIRGDTGLLELLIGTQRGATRPSGSYSALRDWRRGLVLVLATWVVLGALGLLITWLR